MKREKKKKLVCSVLRVQFALVWNASHRFVAMICIQVTFLPCIWPYLKCMGFILLQFVARFGSSGSSYKCGSTFILIIRRIYRLARARCGNFKNRKDDISGCSLITYAIGTKVVCDTRELSFFFLIPLNRKRRGPEARSKYFGLLMQYLTETIIAPVVRNSKKLSVAALALNPPII